MAELFLMVRTRKNTARYFTSSKKFMVSVLKMLPHLQALSWEPELCQCDFVRCLTFGITVQIRPDLPF